MLLEESDLYGFIEGRTRDTTVNSDLTSIQRGGGGWGGIQLGQSEFRDEFTFPIKQVECRRGRAIGEARTSGLKKRIGSWNERRFQNCTTFIVAERCALPKCSRNFPSMARHLIRLLPGSSTNTCSCPWQSSTMTLTGIDNSFSPRPRLPLREQRRRMWTMSTSFRTSLTEQPKRIIVFRHVD